MPPLVRDSEGLALSKMFHEYLIDFGRFSVDFRSECETSFLSAYQRVKPRSGPKGHFSVVVAVGRPPGGISGYRDSRFSKGYYITDHFGQPARIAFNGSDVFLFVEDNADKIVWPFITKLLLTKFAWENSLLHLKCSVAKYREKGVLFVGRGGSGKTVLLQELCRAGASLVTNTHGLYDDQGVVWGVPTNVRVRSPGLFDAAIRPTSAKAVLPGEYLLHPETDLGWTQEAFCNVSAVCMVDYKPGICRVELLEPKRLERFMEQFSLALNVYGLKEDVFEFLGSDVEVFTEYMDQQQRLLRNVLQSCSCLYVSADMLDPKNLDALLGLIDKEPA